MVGGGPGAAELALDGVEPVHRAVLRPPPLAPPLQVRQGVRVGPERVGVQAEDHVRLLQIDHLPQRPAERLPGPLPQRVGGERAVFRPFRPGRNDRVPQPLHGGGVRDPAQHPRARWVLLHRRGEGRDGGIEVALDRPLPGPLQDAAEAVGVVEAQRQGLRKGVARAAAGGRVVRVALDLDRPAVHARHQQRAADAVEFPAGGELLRDARQPAGAADGHRHQLFGLPPAAGYAGQAQRGPHQLQPAPAVEPDRLVRLLRELTMQEVLELRRRRDLVQAPPIPTAVPRRLLRRSLRAGGGGVVVRHRGREGGVALFDLLKAEGSRSLGFERTQLAVTGRAVGVRVHVALRPCHVLHPLRRGRPRRRRSSASVLRR